MERCEKCGEIEGFYHQCEPKEENGALSDSPSIPLLAELHDLAAEWRKKARVLDEMVLKTKDGGDSEKRWMIKAGMFRGCASDLKQVLKPNARVNLSEERAIG